MKNHLSEVLKDISFFKLPSIPYDVLFLRQSKKNDCFIEDKLYKSPVVILKRVFFPNKSSIEYNKKTSAKILFYLSDPNRKSNEVNFKKVVSTSSSSDTIIERRGPLYFSWAGFYLLFVLIPVWIFQMSRRGLYIIEKYQVLKGLIDVYRIQRYFKEIDIEKYNLLVCYYDSILHECMLTLIFKELGVHTATLQHGQFNAWRENTFVNCGLEFLASPSDYQLCWNKFARDEAIKCGWKESQLPVVGVMSNIGRKKERCVKPYNNIFGVVISHPSWEHENIEMIKAANILASKYNLRYYLKLHPNYKEDYFKDKVDADYYIGNVEKGIDTLEYCNMVDFTIVGSTSFYVEMVYCYHDILKYSSLLPSDKYRDIFEGNIFHNSDEIINSFQNLSSISKEKLFDYLCGTSNTYKQYKEFFEKFMI